MVAMHREACKLNGPPPDKAHALHSCDVKRCINPAHLSWGTARRNMIENRDRLHSLGNQKLTPEQARAIKFKEAGSNREVADRYGVSACAVSDIRNGRTWADLTEY